MKLRRITFVFAFTCSFQFVYCQEINVLEFITSEILEAKNVRQIKVFSIEDEKKTISQKLYINSQGLLDSSVLYSPLDTNKIIELQKSTYDSHFRLIKTITKTEMIVNVDLDKEMVTTTSEYKYNDEGLLEQIENNGQHISSNLATYEYRNGQLFKKHYIDTSQDDTISIIKNTYSEQGDLILKQRIEKEQFVWYELYDYDRNGRLIQSHSKNTDPNGRLVFQDDYYYYDSKGNRTKWIRYDSIEKSPLIYEYQYNNEGLIFEYKDPWGKQIIIYE